MKTHYSFENDELTITTGDVETTIEASNCADDDVTITYHELAGVVGNLHRRILDQREILNKLPKCWRLASGTLLVQDCPVVPRMRVWLTCEDAGYHGQQRGKPVEACVMAVARQGDPICLEWHSGADMDFLADRCANSPEAAEALAARSDDAKETKTS